MKRILAVLGDYYHPYEWIKASLNSALEIVRESDEIELIDVTVDKIEVELKRNPDGVILFKENRLNPADSVVHEWMNERVEEAIMNYVKNGGGWLAWHAGLASYPTEGQYINMLRGYFDFHPVEHQIVYYSGDLKEDSLGKLNFEFKDEHYFVNVDEKNTHVFLTSKSVDGTSIGGWYHSVGAGKVCCLTPAHNQEGLLDPSFISVLSDRIKWIMAL